MNISFYLPLFNPVYIPLALSLLFVLWIWWSIDRSSGGTTSGAFGGWVIMTGIYMIITLASWIIYGIYLIAS